MERLRKITEQTRSSLQLHEGNNPGSLPLDLAFFVATFPVEFEANS